MAKEEITSNHGGDIVKKINEPDRLNERESQEQEVGWIKNSRLEVRQHRKTHRKMAVPERQFRGFKRLCQTKSKRIEVGIQIAKKWDLAVPNHFAPEPKDQRYKD